MTKAFKGDIFTPRVAAVQVLFCCPGHFTVEFLSRVGVHLFTAPAGGDLEAEAGVHPCEAQRNHPDEDVHVRRDKDPRRKRAWLWLWN
jgi:hypothetical protein